MIMKLLMYSHILAGIISLIAAPVALAVVKGGDIHRLFGKIFFWCMTWIFVSSMILGLYHARMFLIMVSILSYYLVITGYRTLYHKQLSTGKSVTWYDWTFELVTGLTLLGFGFWGIYLLTTGASGSFIFLLFAFSLGGLMSVFGELKAYIKKPAEKEYWLFNHIGRMISGFIASVTAFSVNVLGFLPGIWPWIWPALVGTPFIIYWIRIYKRKIAEGARITDLVQLKR